jgi:hypothetical protein
MALQRINHDSGRTLTVGACKPIPEGAHRGAKLSTHLAKVTVAIQLASTLSYAQLAAAELAQIYENDKIGDCVIAWGYHLVGVATANANGGVGFIASDQQIIADYETIGGYDPNNPSQTDNGCDPITAFQTWMTKGFADGSKLAGYVAVDQSNPTEIMTAITTFENVTFAVCLPAAWVSNLASLRPGFVWDVAGDPVPANGHCFGGVGYGGPGIKAVGYTSDGIVICTWGMLGIITWAAVAKYASAAAGGGLWSLLTFDQIAKGQADAPNGLDWAGLVAELQTIPGASIAPSAIPAPPPTSPSVNPPAPAPLPTAGEGFAVASALSPPSPDNPGPGLQELHAALTNIDELHRQIVESSLEDAGARERAFKTAHQARIRAVAAWLEGFSASRKAS